MYFYISNKEYASQRLVYHEVEKRGGDVAQEPNTYLEMDTFPMRYF